MNEGKPSAPKQRQVPPPDEEVVEGEEVLTIDPAEATKNISNEYYGFADALRKFNIHPTDLKAWRNVADTFTDLKSRLLKFDSIKIPKDADEAVQKIVKLEARLRKFEDKAIEEVRKKHGDEVAAGVLAAALSGDTVLPEEPVSAPMPESEVTQPAVAEFEPTEPEVQSTEEPELRIPLHLQQPGEDKDTYEKRIAETDFGKALDDEFPDLEAPRRTERVDAWNKLYAAVHELEAENAKEPFAMIRNAADAAREESKQNFANIHADAMKNLDAIKTWPETETLPVPTAEALEPAPVTVIEATPVQERQFASMHEYMVGNGLRMSDEAKSSFSKGLFGELKRGFDWFRGESLGNRIATTGAVMGYWLNSSRGRKTMAYASVSLIGLGVLLKALSLIDDHTSVSHFLTGYTGEANASPGAPHIDHLTTQQLPTNHAPTHVNHVEAPQVHMPTIEHPENLQATVKPGEGAYEMFRELKAKLIEEHYKVGSHTPVGVQAILERTPKEAAQFFGFATDTQGGRMYEGDKLFIDGSGSLQFTHHNGETLMLAEDSIDGGVQYTDKFDGQLDRNQIHHAADTTAIPDTGEKTPRIKPPPFVDIDGTPESEPSSFVDLDGNPVGKEPQFISQDEALRGFDDSDAKAN